MNKFMTEHSIAIRVSRGSSEEIGNREIHLTLKNYQAVPPKISNVRPNIL